MKIRVAVVFGGRSVEHEISVLTGLQAIHAMNEERYEVIPVYITKDGRWFSGKALLKVELFKDIPALLKKCDEVYLASDYGDHHLYNKKKNRAIAEIDVLIPALHGTNGEDGLFQGTIDSCGIPYTGCNVLASANGMDKITMKMILRESNIPVVDYVWFTDKGWFKTRDELTATIESRLGYPVIVKPADLGSSVGISRASNREELFSAVHNASLYATRIIVEKMVQNLREINCSVLGSPDDYKTSVCEEPVRSGAILSYEDKYVGGGQGSKGMKTAQRRLPADLTTEQESAVRRYAGETFRVLSCDGVARVDLMIDADSGAIYVNEINTIPGSMSFYLWEATGIPFAELMDRMIEIAFRRFREQNQKTVSYDHNIFSLGKGLKGGVK